jgi:hypothetical protein
MRIDADGRPWILEVNANPDIAPDAGLARMARAAGIDYPAMMQVVCDHALSEPLPLTPATWALAERLSGIAPTLFDAAAGGQR